VGKCLATSEFKTLYDVAARTDDSESACPTLQHQVVTAHKAMDNDLADRRIVCMCLSVVWGALLLLLCA
jgi:hypothetical protein